MRAGLGCCMGWAMGRVGGLGWRPDLGEAGLGAGRGGGGGGGGGGGRALGGAGLGLLGWRLTLFKRCKTFISLKLLKV